ncbi:MAG: hypothetical protein ACYDAO_04380 [Thermoplasmataceae archaeon]
MMPASREVYPEKVAEQINKLKERIQRYLIHYEDQPFKVEQTHKWLLNSVKHLDKMKYAVLSKSKYILPTNEEVMHVFDTLKDGFKEYTRQILPVSSKNDVMLESLRNINREFLFLEPNLHKLESMGFKTQEQQDQEYYDKLIKEGFKRISPTDLSLSGAKATVNFRTTWGGRETVEGRFTIGTDKKLLLTPPYKRKSGYILGEPVYAKITSPTRKPDAYAEHQHRIEETKTKLQEMERERDRIQNQPELRIEQLRPVMKQIYELVTENYSKTHTPLSSSTIKEIMVKRYHISHTNTSYAIERLASERKIRFTGIEAIGSGIIPNTLQPEYKPIYKGEQGRLF